MLGVPIRIAVLQHHPAEGPGRLSEWARRRGHLLRVMPAWESNAQAWSDNVDALVVLGGPWHLADAPTWFEAERRAVQAWADAARPTLGICLGGQLLAHALGGRVVPLAEPEQGWTPVSFAGGDGLQVLQWHEQAIVLPPAASVRAHSPSCTVQAFDHGPKQRGLQFHPEWDAASVAQLNAFFGADSPLPRENDKARQAAVEAWFFAYLDDWVDAVKDP